MFIVASCHTYLCKLIIASLFFLVEDMKLEKNYDCHCRRWCLGVCFGVSLSDEQCRCPSFWGRTWLRLVFCCCQTNDDTHYKFVCEKYVSYLPLSKEKVSREAFYGGKISGVQTKHFYLTTRGYCSINYARLELMFAFICTALFLKYTFLEIDHLH